VVFPKHRYSPKKLIFPYNETYHDTIKKMPAESSRIFYIGDLPGHHAPGTLLGIYFILLENSDGIMVHTFYP